MDSFSEKVQFLSSQQRWVWTGIAGGADTILFWCWRDEVFGRESAGFGLSGNDGFAQARLDAMRRTGHILRDHADLLYRYRPDPAQVGILFSPQSYYLTWAQEGTGKLAQQAVQVVVGVPPKPPDQLVLDFLNEHKQPGDRLACAD